MTASCRLLSRHALVGVLGLTLWAAAVQAQAPGAPQSPQVPPRGPEVVPEPPPTVPPTNPPGTQTRKPPPPDSNRTVTVTGCLEAARGVPNDRPDSPVEDFLLTNGRVEPPPTAAPGAASTVASSPDSLEGRLTYRVTGLRPERLRPFLNQQVEIKGEFEGGAASAGQPPASRAPVTDPSPKATQAQDWPELKASNITMVAAACVGR